MKPSALHYMLIAVIAVFLFPQVSLANNSVDVNSSTNGQSITCINGHCTTSGGGSKSTVCVNGQCTTTDNGNVDYSSPDGHDQVHIHNNTGDNSVSVSNGPSAGAADVSPSLTETPTPSLTPDPTITQMRNDINNKVQKEITGIKEHVKSQNDAITMFLDQEMKALQELFNTIFK